MFITAVIAIGTVALLTSPSALNAPPNIGGSSIANENEKMIMLDKITPEDILTEGHQSELVTYKGVMVSKQHSEKDLFKINLLNMLNK